MAVHHPATITPSKAELLQAWVPSQPWAASTDTSTLTRLGSYRFDDPDGEVGMEIHLLGTADGQVLQVPLTYRGAPRESATTSLVTTMTHTTLGDRWIYDALHDPVYLTALATTITTGGREADLYEATAAGLVLEPSTTHVRGSGTSPAGGGPGWARSVVDVEGSTTRVRAVSGTLAVQHVPSSRPTTGMSTGPSTGPSTAERVLVLTGTWPGQDAPLVLATLEPAVPAG